jgi:hypothetical protein
VDWRKEPFPCWNHQSGDTKRNSFWEYSCNDFYILISYIPKVLQEIRSSTKFKTSTQEERTTTSP